MKRSVLFVIDSLGCGGAEKSLVSLLPLLNRDKYEIHLWILHRGGVFESLLPNDIIIEIMPVRSIIGQVIYRMTLLYYSAMLRWNKYTRNKEHTAETLWKCIGKSYQVPIEQYDVAIAYQQGLPTYLVSTRINALKKVAWVNVNIFNAGYNPIFNLRYYEKMDYIVPVSKDLEAILNDKYPQFADRYVCVYDILNLDLIKKSAEEPIKEQYLFENKLTFVTVGRLAPQKNYLLAVDVAKVLKDKGLDFRWFFVGEGSERPNIEQRIEQYGLKDKVILLGMRTNPYPYIAQCTIYIQTSSFEGFGLTIAEAKILGKPIVSTNFDVVCDQIEHEQNGLIADMTASSVAQNIVRMLTDDSLRKQIIGKVGKEQNKTYLTEARKVEQILDDY